LASASLTPFAPPWWLRNRHLQSILPSLAPRRRAVLRQSAVLRAASVPLLLDCGDGVRLQAFYAAPAQPDGRLAVLLHGWEGSADAAYLLSLAQDLLDDGCEVIRLNLRDHGDTHHLNSGLFHSCLLPEVAGAVQSCVQHYPGRALWLAGFSLGGNFMLRVAAMPQSPDLGLAGVVAISPVLDPAQAMQALDEGLSVYRRYFIHKWSRSLRRKQALWPAEHDFSDILGDDDLRRMTARLIARHTSYPQLADYFAGYAITGQRLATLTVPATILMAMDDPIIPSADLQRLADNPHLTIHRTRHGGHTGFIDHLSRPSWANRFVLAQMAAHPTLGILS
jgi:hypothetical protein